MSGFMIRFTDALQRKPTRTAVLMGALVVLCVVAALRCVKYGTLWRECAIKRGFLTAGTGFGTSGWYFGSGDAGSGGSLARDTTAQQLGVYMPAFNRNAQLAAARRSRSVQIAAAQANAATVARLNADKKKKLGHALGRDHMLSGLAAGVGANVGCGQPMEPAAVAEIEGLNAVQAFEHPAEGTATLDSVISDAVDDTQLDTTSAQIARMYSNVYRDSV